MQVIKSTEVLNEGLKRQFRIEVPALKVQERMDRLILEKGEKYKEPGFRPGKIPFPRLKKIFTGEALKEAVPETIQETVAEFFKKNAIVPAFKQEYTIESYDDKKGLTYTLALELLPEVPEASDTGIHLRRVKPIILDTDVEHFLQELASSHEKKRPLKRKRPAKKGDVLKVTMELFPKGQKEKRIEDVEFVLEADELRPEILESLLGAVSGQTIETKIPFSQSVSNRKIAGRIVNTRFTVEEILERVPFEVEEELAQFLKFKNLEALRTHARESLEAQGQTLAFLWIKRQILDFFAQKYTFDVPEKLVDMAYHSIWKQTYQEMGISEIPPDYKKEKAERGKLFLEQVEKTEEDLQKFYKKVAERRVRLGFLLTQLGKKMNIKLTDEEIQGALFREMQKYPGQEKSVVQYYRSNPQAFARLQSPLFEDKLLGHIAETKPSEPEEMPFVEVQKLIEKE